jgi:hypothetical protein
MIGHTSPVIARSMIYQISLSFESIPSYKRTFVNWENPKWLRETQSDALGRVQTFVY